jgi:hypothetical protein
MINNYSFDDRSHSETLYAIRKKCLESIDSLRFYDYAINEKYYTNEYNFNDKTNEFNI